VNFLSQEVWEGPEIIDFFFFNLLNKNPTTFGRPQITSENDQYKKQYGLCFKTLLGLGRVGQNFSFF
jgi:hypothetical protein